VRTGTAEQLPYADRTFDATLAQLVVHFMRDPLKGIAEMARVTRKGGVVAACVWDHEGQGPLTPFWRAARELELGVLDEADLPGVREGHLAELFTAAGLRQVEDSALVLTVTHDGFDAYWAPFELGVGPAGAHVARLDPERRAALRARVRAEVPDGRYTQTVRAWVARGIA
jgi:SAM-dependent methyltransferase